MVKHRAKKRQTIMLCIPAERKQHNGRDSSLAGSSQFSSLEFSISLYCFGHHIILSRTMTESSEDAQQSYTYLTDGGENCQRIRDILQKKVRIEITDGRVFTGSLEVGLDGSE